MSSRFALVNLGAASVLGAATAAPKPAAAGEAPSGRMRVPGKAPSPPAPRPHPSPG